MGSNRCEAAEEVRMMERSATVSPANAGIKESYHRPLLVKHGRLREITNGPIYLCIGLTGDPPDVPELTG
jgi:hypothetical protein